MNNEIDCPACGLAVSPVKRKLPGVGPVLAFGFFCPSTSCNARLDHVLAQMKRDESATSDAPKALASMRESESLAPGTVVYRFPAATPGAPSRPRSSADLRQEIPARCAELRARVAALKADLSEAERELSLFERMSALLTDEHAADAAE